jgi:two-component system KDP operon response regulator KdpE
LDAAKIVLIEDDSQIRRFLRVAISNQGYKLIESETAQDGLLQASTQQPDVVILDLGLPDRDGQQVLQELRTWSQVPIIVLSARGREQDKVQALDAGADDYLTKPFEMNELLARLRVLLRRASRSAESHGRPEFCVGNLRIDLERRQVFVGTEEIHLTPTEYRLLLALVKDAGKVVTHRQLLSTVWGPGHSQENHYVRIYMGHLRQKIEADPARPRYLMTEPGVGYRLLTE